MCIIQLIPHLHTDDKEKDFVNEYCCYFSKKALIMKVYGIMDGH